MPSARSSEPSESARSQRLVVRLATSDPGVTKLIEDWLSVNAPGARLSGAVLANPAREGGAPVVAAAIDGLSRAEADLISVELAALGGWDLAAGPEVLQSDHD